MLSDRYKEANLDETGFMEGEILHCTWTPHGDRTNRGLEMKWNAELAALDTGIVAAVKLCGGTQLFGAQPEASRVRDVEERIRNTWTTHRPTKGKGKGKGK